jgi:ribosomal protein S18 acetylase RimI-like enzyme
VSWLVAVPAHEALGSRRAQIEELWRVVWPRTTSERFEASLPRHAGREGFLMLLASSADGQGLDGLVYGYRGAPGQWWHDRVAEAMTAAQRERWLRTGHFELVELMVHPSARRNGLGGQLHDSILDADDAETAVLSTQVDNGPALTLYRGRGWRTILPELLFAPGEPPYTVLGWERGSTDG